MSPFSDLCFCPTCFHGAAIIYDVVVVVCPYCETFYVNRNLDLNETDVLERLANWMRVNSPIVPR